MRNAFARSLLEMAKTDERIVLLSGDIGNRMFDPFKAAFPHRFFNCGVAEANMIGVAAGLAASGKRPVAYTITPFITARCLEQIRVDLCYHELPVVVAAVGAGLSYSSLGPTHHACEDIAWLRSLPGMTVLCPGDAREVESLLPQALTLGGPSYLRLGKKGEPIVHVSSCAARIGTALEVRAGDEIAILSTGNVLPLAIETADRLSTEEIRAGVYSVHTVKPLDESLLAKVFREAQLVVTVEEHSRVGGFGGAVAEWRSDFETSSREHGPGAPLLRLGTADEFVHSIGSHEEVRTDVGVTPDAFVSRILDVVTSRTSPLRKVDR